MLQSWHMHIAKGLFMICHLSAVAGAAHANAHTYLSLLQMSKVCLQTEQLGLQPAKLILAPNHRRLQIQYAQHRPWMHLQSTCMCPQAVLPSWCMQHWNTVSVKCTWKYLWRWLCCGANDAIQALMVEPDRPAGLAGTALGLGVKHRHPAASKCGTADSHNSLQPASFVLMMQSTP